MVEDFMSCFTPSSVDALIDRFVKCNNNNYRCIILNVDGNCLGSHVRAGFGGLIRNSSSFIHGSSDIMLAKLYVIYHGLILAKDVAIEDFVCYSDSLPCINLIKCSISKFHVHAVLIQDTNKLLSHNNVTLCHTLIEENQCAEFLAKLRASSNVNLVIHSSPLTCMFDFLKSDTTETIFIRE
ncbi:ribonuclease H [Trifolium pratense]|uniref:Ribonuclease H n=1 Tax=Trifolium pratense TaxID=57577 RepID=A0A2K3MU03_TRIPR|nr:ribonuclease H [Trifolium pratense]